MSILVLSEHSNNEIKSCEDVVWIHVKVRNTNPDKISAYWWTNVGVQLQNKTKNREEVSDGPMGCHGYCMRGPYALAAAARFPDQIGAAASFYGTWLVNDAEESPHGTFSKTNAEVYIACAEYDELAPLPMVDELRSLFKRSQAPGEIEMYTNVHHGFAFPERWCYDKAAAERHWERLLNLYKRKL